LSNVLNVFLVAERSAFSLLLELVSLDHVVGLLQEYLRLPLAFSHLDLGAVR